MKGNKTEQQNNIPDSNNPRKIVYDETLYKLRCKL